MDHVGALGDRMVVPVGFNLAGVVLAGFGWPGTVSEGLADRFGWPWLVLPSFLLA